MNCFEYFTYDYDLVMSARLSLPLYVTVKLDRKHEATVFRNWSIVNVRFFFVRFLILTKCKFMQ